MGATRPPLDPLPAEMADDARDLVERARNLLNLRYRAGVHEVASAMRTQDGRVHLGLHIEATAGRASLCAEGAALGAAVASGSPVVAIASVLRRPSGTWHLIEPCGVCAELLSDHCADATLWVAVAGVPEFVTVRDLLPARHERSGRNSTTPQEDS